MIRGLKAAILRTESRATVVECRRCGASVDDADAETCPDCGSDEIARYDF